MASPRPGLDVLAPFPPPYHPGDPFEVLAGHAGERVRPLPDLHHPDAIARSVELDASDFHSRPVAEIHASQHEPVRLVGWWREVGLVVVGSEVEAVIFDPCLLGLALGHPI